MCAVLLSQPIPVKNLFRTGLPRKINVFPRTSAYFRRDKKKKNGDGRGKLANKFTPCSITVASASVQSREAGFELM